MSLLFPDQQKIENGPLHNKGLQCFLFERGLMSNYLREHE